MERTIDLTKYRKQQGLAGLKNITIREVTGLDEDRARQIAATMSDASRFLDELIKLSIVKVDGKDVGKVVDGEVIPTPCTAYDTWSTRLRSIVRQAFNLLNYGDDKEEAEDFRKALSAG